MSTSQTLSHAWMRRARAVSPGGVSSPVRAFGAVGGEPRVMASASGPWLVDVDGTRYVDLIGSWGPMILGHAHPQVLDAVQQAASRGFSFGAPTPTETELAEEIIARVEPLERVRLVSSGTEATMTAVRLARGATGRDVVVKFAGHYHGHVDALLAAGGSGLATFAVPDSVGVPGSVTQDTIVLPYNDVEALRAAFAEHGHRIAAVITEAAAGNMGIVPPDPGFTQTLLRTAHEAGALVISDEVMTGFRAGPSGWFGVEGPYDDGERPDLFTFGKVMGGGFPAAALGGSRALMEHLTPTGSVYQAGTLSGNPVATAAGVTTLRLCTPDVYEHVGAVGRTVAAATSEALDAAGVPHRVQWAGTMFSIFFGEGPASAPVRTYDDARNQDLQAFRAFFHAMLDQGVHLPPSAYEAWFLSASHDEEAIGRVLEALPSAAVAAAAHEGATRG